MFENEHAVYVDIFFLLNSSKILFHEVHNCAESFVGVLIYCHKKSHNYFVQCLNIHFRFHVVKLWQTKNEITTSQQTNKQTNERIESICWSVQQTWFESDCDCAQLDAANMKSYVRGKSDSHTKYTHIHSNTSTQCEPSWRDNKTISLIQCRTN